MSIDDLEAERSNIFKKIYACEQKIKGLEKTKETLDKEIKDLNYDMRCTNTILKKLRGIPGLLNKSDTNINGARDIVASYYNGHDTEGWRRNLKQLSDLAGSIKGNINEVSRKGSEVFNELTNEVRKKGIELAKTEANLKTAREDLERYESDLDDIQWEIENYDYDDE